MDNRRLAETSYMTVNTRGLALDVPEIVKGHLVRVVSDVSHVEGEALAAAWNRIRREAGEYFDGLLRTVSFLLFNEADSYEVGVDLIDQFPDGAEGALRAKRWVHNDLPRYWAAYAPMASTPSRGQALVGATLELRELSFLPWHEWRSVALWFLERSGRDLAKRLRQLKQACYALQLLGWSQRPANRAYVMGRALQELNDGLSPFRHTPRGRASEQGPLYIYRENRQQARAALMASLQGFERYRPIARLTEVVLWLDAGLDPPGFVGGGSVEHVLPRTPGYRWRDAFPRGIERERLKDMLGNLCLIPSHLNQGLGTAPFAEKRAALQRLNPSWRSAHDVAGYSTWNADAIHRRTHRLAQKVAKHLGLG